MGLFDLTLRQQITADAHTRAVWAAFAGIESWPRWNSPCKSVEVLEGTPWTPGFRFHMVLRMAGVPVPFEPVVVEAEPERRVRWTSRRLTVTGIREFTFTALAGGQTLITDEKCFSSPILPVRLFYPRPIITRMSNSWLVSLAREAQRKAEG